MEESLRPLPRITRQTRRQHTIRILRRDWQCYAMALPAIVLLVLFAYLPMAGLVIAFKEYDFVGGIFGSPWIKPIFRNFEVLFGHNPAAWRAIRNTLLLNALFISAGTVFALALSLAFNEVTHSLYKRITQSLSFLPYFISTVVVGIFVSGLLNYETGTVNHLIEWVGGERVQFYMEPARWPLILLAVNIWKGAGYSAVVYLATISGIDPAYYESARIDGATRRQQIWHISLPLLRPTVVILTILAVGRIMNADFGLFFNITGDTPSLYATTDVIDTFIFRTLRQTGDIAISSATGFFQSIVSFCLVLFSNRIARRIEESASLF